MVKLDNSGNAKNKFWTFSIIHILVIIMEITKYGDFYTVSDTKSTYGISGNLIKSLSGEIIIDVFTHVLNDTTNIISLIHGSYNPQ